MTPRATSVKTADDFRLLERSRLQALVECDMPRALPLHAVDFQLITPRGASYTRDQYLQEVESGGLRYLKWDPEDIAVHAFPEVAVLRYRAQLEMDSGSGAPARFVCWHTDTYELREGLWQVVWSHATAVK
ncbi:nuclear transport factor 2 family protein [Caldimonas brevitalea]|nr:nuclear transport factor 2 family protein [Caldimonas brevitalea]